MQYLISSCFFAALSLLFSYFSYFLKVDDSSSIIKLIVFMFPTIIFTFFFMLYIHFYKLKDLSKNINLVLFPIIFISMSFLSSQIYTKVIYFNLNKSIIKNNVILPDNEYSEFLEDFGSNNKDKLFFYLHNKKYITSVEERLNYQIINLINESKDPVMRELLLPIIKDKVVTEKEFDSIKESLITNFEKTKADKNLSELYKITFTLGKNYGKD